MPSRVAEGQERGWIIPIGGAEDKESGRRILKRFVELCGGRDADIAIIPTASKLADTGARYVDLFDRLEAGRATSLDIRERADGEKDDILRRLETANGVFLTGGNQLRISTIIGGTSAAKLIRTQNAKGVHVAGTSAGAGVLSEHMIAFGREGSSPRGNSVRLAPGLGLTNRFIIDQHFRQRDRLGRLAAALAYNPFAIGIGLDEDTAAFIGPDDVVEVEGSGGVTVVDAGGLTFSSMAEVKQTQAACLLGLTVHILTAGSTYNLHTRHASPGTLLAAES